MTRPFPPPRTAVRRPAAALRDSARPPRYRLLTAAARIPQREPPREQVTFLRACPACGLSVFFTQVTTSLGSGYLVEQHDCVDADAAGRG